MMRSWARRSLAALTIFIARVSCIVLLIDRMRRLMSWVFGHRVSGAALARDAVRRPELVLGHLADALLQPFLQLVGQAALVGRSGSSRSVWCTSKYWYSSLLELPALLDRAGRRGSRWWRRR